jgi:CheY-like chemotaxis protein
MDTILIADDNETHLKQITAILHRAGFNVKTAANPKQAMDLLRPEKIKAAILDYRLNGGDAEDDSGLFVAENSNRQIPKIMISGLADEGQIRAAFGVDDQGRTVVLQFLDKDEVLANPPKLVEAIERAVETRLIWDQRDRESIQGQLLLDYKNARRFDLINTAVSFIVNVVFILVLINTLHWIHTGEAGVVISSIVAIGIIVSEVAVNLFLAKRIEGSGRRAENYHNELLQAWRFEQLMRSADNLDYVKNRNEAKHEVISAFANRWNNTNPLDDYYSRSERAVATQPKAEGRMIPQQLPT